MKVLIVSPCILPVPAVKGGAVLTLIESIAAQNEIKKEMNLSIVASFDEEAQRKALCYPNTEFIFLKNTKIYDEIDKCIDRFLGKVTGDKKKHQYIRKLYIISQIKKIMVKNEYDKIIFQNSGFLLNVIRDKSLQSKYKGKLYYHLHNDIPDKIYVDGVKKCKLILVSNFLAGKVNKICDCDMSDKMYIVKNGINVDVFSQQLQAEEKNQLLNSLQIAENKKIVVFSGRITAEKGISQLIDAFIQLDREDVILLIVGSHNFGSGQTSDFEMSVQEKCKKISNRIVLTGFVPYNAMWKYYKLADIVVLPSIWNEPAGLTMIEAAACGVPVITTNAGGIPEYLNKDLALFVPKDEKIVSSLVEAINVVFENQDKWKAIADKASRYVRDNFSETTFYEQLLFTLKK